jgi:hypothetical protein
LRPGASRQERMRLSAEMFDQIVAALKSDSHRDKDKRREPRVGMAGEADLVTVGENGKRAAGKVRVRDISASGIGIVFSQNLNKDQRFVIQLESAAGEPVWLVCLTAYCKKANGNFSIGAKIKQVMRSDQIHRVEAQTAAASSIVAHTASPVDIADIARISKAIIG